MSLRITSQKTHAEVCRDLCTGLIRLLARPWKLRYGCSHNRKRPRVAKTGRPDGRVNSRGVAIRDFAPRNAIEASLVAQMTMTGEAGQMFLYRATLADIASEFMTQMLPARADCCDSTWIRSKPSKLRGLTGQQKVIVEHVSVQAGGQAIVGTIEAPTATRGGGGQ